MKTPKVINWGIIGLGKIAKKFAEDLHQVEHAQLFAVASRDQEKANKFANTFNAKVAYNNYEDLAKDPDIHAVYIATPHAFHKAHSILCLHEKKAVLCEKPFAMNAYEVQEMISTAKANDTLLMEAMWTYFLPHYQFVLKHTQDKTYGKLTKLEADFGFQPEVDMTSRVFNKSLGGGSLLDIGIYPIFAALSTLGEPIQIESKATFFDNDVDSSCLMIFSYGNGVEAHLKSTLLEKTPTEAIFYFEKGVIKINSRFHQPTHVTMISEGKEETMEFGYSTHGYSFEIDHFNELIRQGQTESNVMTYDFSRKLMTLLDTVRQQIGLKYA